MQKLEEGHCWSQYSVVSIGDSVYQKLEWLLYKYCFIWVVAYGQPQATMSSVLEVRNDT